MINITKNKKFKIIKKNTQKGSTLFFAVIVTTLILTIGLAIAQIIVTDLKVTSDVANSKLASYAAKAGIENALLQFDGEDINSITNTDPVCLDPPTNKVCYDIRIDSASDMIYSTGVAYGIRKEMEISVRNSIVSFWHFNEGSGTTVADSSGNGNHGFFPAAAPNLLLNPSFESHTSWEPHNWSAFGSFGDIMVSNWPIPPDGTLSLRVEFQDDLITYYGARQSVSVTPGAQYRLSGWLRRSMDNGTWQCDVQGTGIDSPGIKLTSNANWTYKTETVTIPGGTSSVYIRCFGDSNPESEEGNADALEFVSTSNTAPTWVDGKKGSALSFDGINDYVEVGDQDVWDNTPIAIEAWVYPTDNTKTRAVIVNHGDTGIATEGWWLSLDQGKPTFQYRDATPAWLSVASPDVVSLNTWVHIVAVKDPNSVTIYVDGIDKGSTPTTTALVNSPRTMKIGTYFWGGSIQSSDNGPFEGIIDEVVFHNKALTAEEILSRASR